ncbi:UMP kinase [Patescibacteria group bacterium]|nr:UMP kinase [Patescibacteria group bacterium]MBU1673408.1 UMP kinase [Patescibacteria group bacterium]MBU1963312.1 UMP kinase [Patescibacteria group bacterium]
MKNKIVISLGGSLLVPEQIDAKFYDNFRKLINRNLKKFNFILIAGGGKYARNYQEAGRKLGLKKDKLDWLGIGASHNNAWLLNYTFENKSPEQIYFKPAKIAFNKPVHVSGGWKPGWSTDYVATQFAVKNKIDTVVNLSNIEYIYDKDPNKYKSAKKLKELTWKEYEKMIGSKWTPGMSAPFDPIATKLAKKHNIKLVSISGKNLSNVSNYLAGKAFKGSVIDNK